MFVDEQGERNGRPVLAIHGWAGTHRDFAALAARRPAGVRWLAADLPACGRSPPPAAWTFEALADELAREIQERDLRGVTLAGFCSGAVVAAFAAARLPDRVARLVLIEPFARLPWYFRLFTLGAAGRTAYGMTFASPAGRARINRFLRRWQKNDANFMAAFEDVDHAATHRYLEMFARADPRSLRLPDGIPVHLVRGTRTFAVVRRSVHQLAAATPHARVHLLAHNGHLPLVHSARELAALVFGMDPPPPS